MFIYYTVYAHQTNEKKPRKNVLCSPHSNIATAANNLKYFPELKRKNGIHNPRPQDFLFEFMLNAFKGEHSAMKLNIRCVDIYTCSLRGSTFVYQFDTRGS